MRPTFKITAQNSMPELLERLKKVAGTQVKVGILGDDTQKMTGSGEDATLLEVAVYNEFGVPSRGIPERSFLRSTWVRQRKNYEDVFRAALRDFLLEGTPLEAPLDALGRMMVNDIRGTITDGAGVAPPNAPATLRRKAKLGFHEQRRRKKNKGKSHDEIMAISQALVRPLVDTGQLVRSISYAVVRKGGGA